MKLKLICAAALLVAPAAATAMPVATFLAKASSLQSKGPLALFSGDLKLLTNQIKADSVQLRADNQAAVKAGRRKAYCTPAGGVALSQTEVMRAMQAVPPAQRGAVQTKEALRAYLAKRFPCPA
jgi:hypothetical protein